MLRFYQPNELLLNGFFSMRNTLSFSILFMFVATSNAQNKDISILRSINKRQTPFKTTLYKYSSNSAYSIPFVYPSLFLLIGKTNKSPGMVKESFFSATSLGAVCALSYTLKQTIRRPRPYVTYPDLIIDKPAKTFSFPSGHTAVAFCTATSISLYYNKWYVTAPAFLWAGLVSTSRMYLGKHYPTDVIGGILLGTAIPLLFHYCMPVNNALDRTGKLLFKY